MSTFHPFTRLPAEIRLIIWEEAVPVREVYIVGRWGNMPIRGNWILDPKLPPPALVHVCRESRNLGLYKKAFYRDVFRCAEEPLWFHWINFDRDIFQFSYDAVRELHGPEVEMIRHIIVKIPRYRNRDIIMTGVPKKYPRIETCRSRLPRIGEPDDEEPYVCPHGPDRS
ncbi:hypothetical protein B0T11DRAFT_345706 [Plectosphaerella cucumerina]|uniref:2EXR domain-containing protein n=1 Tax=Plectosphaerella cucumerina TaxID=40658 RepID=A0A8K0X9J6_9PEZI|nr:hypothetical protein B0T11DRAFT_345706 [Plectosphaerella cucumerina]